MLSMCIIDSIRNKMLVYIFTGIHIALVYKTVTIYEYLKLKTQA